MTRILAIWVGASLAFGLWWLLAWIGGDRR